MHRESVPIHAEIYFSIGVPHMIDTPLPSSSMQNRKHGEVRKKTCHKIGYCALFTVVFIAATVVQDASQLAKNVGDIQLDFHSVGNLTHDKKRATSRLGVHTSELKAVLKPTQNLPSSFPCCKRRPYCLDKCWFGSPPVQLKEEEYKMNKYTQSCCRTKDGGIPLDITLKDRVFSRKTNGFFVEAGGQDGVFQSNTLVAEKFYGWHGLLIEPSKSLIPWCKRIRTSSRCIHGALVGENGPRYVTIQGESPTGKVQPFDENRGDQKVQSFALSALLSQLKIKTIDFFSLDVEGNEYDALMGVNFAVHRPKYILIEVWDRNQKIFEKMTKEGYILTSGVRYGHNDVSGWAHFTRHRDFLWKDGRA